jgi:hypothetical protein
LKNISILGDSRAFDTYYTNNRYDERYGYDKTFPHLWRRIALLDQSASYDVIHIPDHFRSRTVQNNIIRLGLTNPAIVFVLDGIWESLLNKNHFVEFVETRLRALPKSENSIIELRYSPSDLVKLFKENQLSVSPDQFGERARHIVSYFLALSRRSWRRAIRRGVVWFRVCSFVSRTYSSHGAAESLSLGFYRRCNAGS